MNATRCSYIPAAHDCVNSTLPVGLEFSKKIDGMPCRLIAR